MKAKPRLSPCVSLEYQFNKGFSLRGEGTDCTGEKKLSKRTVSTITTTPKNPKVLKSATSSPTPIIYETLFLKAFKYCFIPRCGSTIQRYVSYMAKNKNYLLLKWVFSSLVPSHYRRIPSQPAFMHQGLVIPKQILKTAFLQLMFWLFKKAFLQFPYKILFHPQNKH